MTMHKGQHYQGRPRASMNGNTERLATFLGWFSIGLGLAEVVAPGTVAKLVGIRDRSSRREWLRLYGLREIAAGFGILTGSKSAGWLWGRVAGDVVDLASLGAAMTSDDSKPGRLGAATAAVLGVTALDVYCGQQLSRIPSTDGRMCYTKSITINRSPEDIYPFWRNFENLPKLMEHLESVENLGERRAHWKVNAPMGMTVEFDSEVVREEPNSMIAWRSVEGSDVHTSGTVRFERATGGRGTVVRLELVYTPPGGAVGAAFAKLFGKEPGQQADIALRRLKQIMETGSVMKSDASIHRGMHAAQPSGGIPHNRPVEEQHRVRRHDEAEQPQESPLRHVG